MRRGLAALGIPSHIVDAAPRGREAMRPTKSGMDTVIVDIASLGGADAHFNRHLFAVLPAAAVN